MTLLNGGTIIYDNNGIETNTYGAFYDNTNGPPNAEKPGGLSGSCSRCRIISLSFLRVTSNCHNLRRSRR